MIINRNKRPHKILQCADFLPQSLAQSPTYLFSLPCFCPSLCLYLSCLCFYLSSSLFPFLLLRSLPELLLASRFPPFRRSLRRSTGTSDRSAAQYEPAPRSAVIRLARPALAAESPGLGYAQSPARARWYPA